MTGSDPETLARELAARHSSTGGADTRSPGLESAEIVQLPLWGSEQFGAPVSILRSALFGVVKPGRRAYLKDQEMESWPGTTIRYTGERLDQADLDVWLQTVQMHQEQTDMGLGSRITLNQKGFLRAIQRNTGKKDRDWLRSSMLRMVASAVQVQVADKEYAGSLIYDFERDESSGRYIVELNPKLSRLFSHGWTKLEQCERLALGKAQLAKALHGFIHTHRATASDPLKVGFERLHAMYGDHHNRRRDFVRAARQALAGLQERGYITDYADDGRNVAIIK